MQSIYKNRPLLFSIILHLALFLFLLIELVRAITPAELHSTKRIKQPVIKAVAVDSQQVQDEINKIKARKREERLKMLARERKLRKMREQARRAKQKRLREQAKIKKMRAKQRALAKKRKAEQKRLAALKEKQRKQRAALRAREKAEQKRIKQAEAKRQKVLAEAKRAQAEKEKAEKAIADAAAARQKAAQLRHNQALINRYAALIKQAVERRWIIPHNANKKLLCRLQIRLAPTGTVLSVSIVSTSGDKALDRSAIAAVYKASPLPVPTQPELFDKFRLLRLTVRPEGLLNG